VNSLDLLDRALVARISLAPGPMFSATKKFENCIRLNCGNPWTERIERAIVKLGQLAAEQLE
jgi:DNA-binding transcriptional MocR family regulator